MALNVVSCEKAICLELEAKRNCLARPRNDAFDPMYGPAVRCKRLRRDSGERSCINVSGL